MLRTEIIRSIEGADESSIFLGCDFSFLIKEIIKTQSTKYILYLIEREVAVENAICSIIRMEEHLLDKTLYRDGSTYGVLIDISPLSVPVLLHHDKLVVELPITSLYFFHDSHGKWHLDERCG